MPTYHSNAKTNHHIRNLIQDNPDGETFRQFAERLRVSVATVHKWRRRGVTHRHVNDRSSRPLHSRTAFSPSEEELIVHLRTSAELALDDLLDNVQAHIPHATRSSVFRLLVRRGENRLPGGGKDGGGQDEHAAARPCFDDEAARTPGFLHIDSFTLRGPQHCFVAVDRATRMVFLHVYDRHDSAAACDFLRRCRAFFEFAIHTVLTDNGGEYTLKGCAPEKHAHGFRRPFDDLCAEHGIRHRTTRPYRPQTNGLAERTNGLVKEGVIKGRRYIEREARTAALLGWCRHYNLNRRNRRIPIGTMTPFQAVLKWYATNPELFPGGAPDAQHLTSNLLCSQPPGT